MSTLFYYTGMAVWIIVAFMVSIAMLIALIFVWDRNGRPSLLNIHFALFGKSKKEKKTYYELWCQLPRWHYRYYTKSEGSRNFARCAMKRLVAEARKERTAARRKKEAEKEHP